MRQTYSGKIPQETAILLNKIEQKLKLFLLIFFKKIFRPEKIPLSNIKNLKKVIVVRIDERLGNLIILLPMLRILKNNGIDTTLLASEKFGMLAENETEKIILFNKKKLLFAPWKIFALYFKLRRESYDLVIDAGHISGASVLAGLLISSLRSRIKAGYKKKYSGLFLTTQIKPSSQDLHAITYHYELLKSINIKIGKIENPEISVPGEYIRKINEMLKIKGSFIAIHPGARGGKDWGVDNFTNLMKMIKFKYDMNFVIIIGPQDFEKKGCLAAEKIFCPRNLFEFGALLKSASALICNDSGPMHFAAAVGTPVFVLFKSSNYPGFYPLTDKKMILKSENIRGVTVEEAFKNFEKFMSKYLRANK